MKTIKPNDIVLGYTLRTRIGSGGYGEVWSAEAPGGMMKAVKFIYGYHDEDRARTELKSLDRIKLVRHPFLLSLERIQVVSGQLIVITELGDKSLADLFRETKAASGTGIPRVELLQYMRDAADGLDYLAQTHSLQHLDIKPENLLLLSGHIKIADFGLVKEVHDATQSLMNGLTPIYAPPELFDGRPHRNSDQYSLAIVYQEMLTGTRPFTGTSAAQLAAQHINGKPSLQALPTKDQPIIARALAKDPSLRYNSCREMIDELVERKSRVSANRARSAPELRTETTMAGCIMEEGTRRGFTSRLSAAKFPGADSHAVPLPPLDLSGVKGVLRPTLVVGVGRTAALTLSRVRERLVQQFGAANTPAIGLLCLDTDPNILTKLAQSSPAIALGDSNIVPVPLKNSEYYRDQGSSRFGWMSRRWIYNIPRSGQTEGLRPLGRLAFVDHATAILRRLKELASEISKPESVAATAEATGLDPCPHRVNVVLVTSSAGGAGSGMAIDLAYAIRSVFNAMAIDDVRLTGMLIHTTPRGQNEQVLAIANSLSLLTEIRHVNQFGYPGDESCGLPCFEDEPVFDHMYMQHLGDALSASAFEARLRGIGDYIFNCAATHCQMFTDQCREQNDSSIRSVRTLAYGLSQQDALQELSRDLAAALSQRWLSLEQAKARLPGDPWIDSTRTQRQLEPAQVQACAAEWAAEHIERVRAAWFKESPTPAAKAGLDEALVRAEQHLQTLCEQMGLASEYGNSRPSLELRGTIDKQGQQLGRELNEQLWNLVSLPPYRLGGAAQLTLDLIHLLREDVDQLRKKATRSKSRQQELRQCLGAILAPAKKADSATATWELWREQFFAACAEQFEFELAAHYLSSIVRVLCETEGAMQDAAGDLRRRIEDCLPPPTNDPDGTVGPDPFPTLQLKEQLRRKMDELVSRTDNLLQHGWLHDAGGLLQVISDPLRRYMQLPQTLWEACNRVMTRAQSEISLTDLAAARGMGPAELTSWIAAQIDASKPPMADGRGEVRLMIAHSGNPATSEVLAQVSGAASLQPTIVIHSAGDLIFCQEMQEIPFAQVVYRLLEGRSDALEYAVRLHSRTDVEWSSLNELFQMC